MFFVPSQEDIPAIRLMMVNELQNKRVIPTICGKDVDDNKENIFSLYLWK